MSLTFKLLSLVIRTAAKPIGNYIKRQAHEHEGFRQFAINQAQRVHRVDMRMRLGLLHDPEAQQRMFDREQKAAEEKKKKAEFPTVRTEEEQRKHDEQKAQDGQAEGDVKKKREEKKPKVRIRPLSDARAIELGANFFSETFIFMVAVGLLLAENFRSSRSAKNKRDELTERIDDLEAEVERLRHQHDLPELEALNERIKKSQQGTYWWNPAGWWKRTEPDADVERIDSASHDTSRIRGNVPGPSPEMKVKAPAGPEDKAATAPPIQDGRERESKEASSRPQRVDSVHASHKER